MKYGKDNSSSVEQVPESCCIKPKGDELSKEKILECQTNPDDYDLKGCYEKLKDSVKNHKKKILGVALTILVIMVIIKKLSWLCLLSWKLDAVGL